MREKRRRSEWLCYVRCKSYLGIVQWQLVLWTLEDALTATKQEKRFVTMRINQNKGWLQTKSALQQPEQTFLKHIQHDYKLKINQSWVLSQINEKNGLNDLRFYKISPLTGFICRFLWLHTTIWNLIEYIKGWFMISLSATFTVSPTAYNECLIFAETKNVLLSTGFCFPENAAV